MRSDRLWCMALALVLGTPAVASRLDRVVTRSGANASEVLILGSNLRAPRISKEDFGTRLELEFDALMTAPPQASILGRNGLQSVRVASNSPKTVSVGIDLEAGARTKMVATSGGWRVRVVGRGVTFSRPTAPVKPVVSPIVQSIVAANVPVPATKPMLVAPKVNPSLAKRGSGKVSLDFVNTDVVQVLKALALQSSVNIITAPDVKGPITISLTNVAVEDALKMVTSLCGFAYAEIGDTYVVAAPLNLKTIYRQITGEPEPTPESQVTDIYVVHSYNAETLVATVAGVGKNQIGNVSLTYTPAPVKEQMAESGIVRQFSSTILQGIVMRGPESEVKLLREMFDKLLVRGVEENSIEVLEVKYVNPSSLREQLMVAVPGVRAVLAPGAAANPRTYRQNESVSQGSTVAGVAAPNGNQGGTDPSAEAKAKEDDPARRSGGGLMSPYSAFEPIGIPLRIVLRGTPDQIRLAREYAAKVDLAPRQVALELRVMELNREEALQIGLDWSLLTGSSFVRNIRMNQNGTGATAGSAGAVSGAFQNGSISGSVVGTLDQISTKQNLIARPNILAIDGRESELFVGDVIRYVKSIQATQNGITVVVDEERVGVRLAVFPRVGADGSITLDMRPLLSYLRSFTPVPGGGQLPQTSERMTQATAVLRSGDTIALGGLIHEQDRRDIRGIPILRDLPLFGNLFRRTDKSKVRTEIVFFLTAKVVEDSRPGDAAKPKQ